MHVCRIFSQRDCCVAVREHVPGFALIRIFDFETHKAQGVLGYL